MLCAGVRQWKPSLDDAVTNNVESLIIAKSENEISAYQAVRANLGGSRGLVSTARGRQTRIHKASTLALLFRAAQVPTS